MNTHQRIVQLAADAHRECWSHGCNVSEQTKKSQSACKRWQELVTKEFGGQFTPEKAIEEKGAGQKIDLVDETDRVAYELKASKNNVHMEIYRDVFKALVFNRRNPANTLGTLVFIAPKQGIDKLSPIFLTDVKAIAKTMKLELVVEGI
jgi:hypothetical protein